jgi:hypothetical protein
VDETHVEALSFERGRRRFAQRHIASTQQDKVFGLSELTHDFQANTLIGAGTSATRDVWDCMGDSLFHQAGAPPLSINR